MGMPDFNDGGRFEKALDTVHKLFSVNKNFAHRNDKTAEDIENIADSHKLCDSHYFKNCPTSREIEPKKFTKNINNEILARGAKLAGYYPEVIARNTVGCVDCGVCCHGCPYNAKQSTITSQLEPLADSELLRLIPNCYVERVDIENGVAIGVTAVVTNTATGEKTHIKVRAKVVVSSAGSLHRYTCLLILHLYPNYIFMAPFHP